MGYLMLPNGVPDFNKAVISLWFRVPQASVDAAAASYSFGPFIPATQVRGPGSYSQFDPLPSEPVLNGVIPLLIFGKQQTQQQIVKNENVDLGAYTSHEMYFNYAIGGGDCQWHEEGPSLSPIYPTYFATQFTRGEMTSCFPCCIGIQCIPANVDEGYDTPQQTLVVYLQTDGYAKFTGMNVNATGFSPSEVWAYGDVFNPGGGCSEASFFNQPNPHAPPSPIIADFSNEFFNAKPEFFTAGGQNIVPDQWHHLLLSFDLSTPCIAKGVYVNSLSDPSTWTQTTAEGTSSACRIWLALDDADQNGSNLSMYWVDGGDDMNAVLTGNAYFTAHQIAFSDVWEQGTSVGSIEPTCAYEPAPIPASGYSFGLPAHSEFVDNIYKVELAEFLLFTGVTLDTSVEENRRLFITNKDKNGAQFPVNPSPTYIPINKEAIGDPVTWEPGADAPAFVPPLSALDPSATGSGNKQLGMPVVDFTKCSFNWMMGRNLGSATGKTVKAGKIKAYMPDPKLGS